MFDQTNVIPLRPRARPQASAAPKTILERVYAAGSLALPVDDRATRTAALMLQALGLVVIEEVLANGSSRRLERGKARAAMDRPWRLAKPAFSGEIGVPDARA